MFARQRRGAAPGARVTSPAPPEKPAPALLPGHGCPPGIRPGTASIPSGDGGCRQKCTGILCRRHERGGGCRQKQGIWSVRDRGGGTSSPSPSAPPPVAISPRSTAWGDPGEEPGTATPLISQARTPSRGGAGEERRRCGWGGGCRQECTGILCRRRGRGGGAGEK